MDIKLFFIVVCILITLILLYLVLQLGRNESFSNPRQEIINKKPYDSFYAPIYSVLISDQVVDKTKFEVKDLLKVTRLKEFQNAKLLDIGAGGGDHLMLFAKKEMPNLELTALDSSKYMLAETRKRFNNKKVDSTNVRFLHRSVHEEDLFMQGTFSHITCYYFTMYQVKLKKTLKNIHSWLRPGGWFVVHVVDLDKFDPILDAASPFVGTTLQRYTKNRITESKVHFKNFTYLSNFTHKKLKSGKEKAYFDETFKYHKEPIIKKQRHDLNAFTTNDFVKQMTKLSFDLKHTTNLKSLNYPFQYILYFQK
tara:strand:- start:11277 stop:12203 length:927 start_codon:yes stop_codon:yes gene_type:complete